MFRKLLVGALMIICIVKTYEATSEQDKTLWFICWNVNFCALCILNRMDKSNVK